MANVIYSESTREPINKLAALVIAREPESNRGLADAASTRANSRSLVHRDMLADRAMDVHQRLLEIRRINEGANSLIPQELTDFQAGKRILERVRKHVHKVKFRSPGDGRRKIRKLGWAFIHSTWDADAAIGRCHSAIIEEENDAWIKMKHADPMYRGFAQDFSAALEAALDRAA